MIMWIHTLEQGGPGHAPLENFDKMVQSGAIWCNLIVSKCYYQPRNQQFLGLKINNNPNDIYSIFSPRLIMMSM